MNEFPGSGLERFLRYALVIVTVFMLWTMFFYKAPDCYREEHIDGQFVYLECTEKE